MCVYFIVDIVMLIFAWISYGKSNRINILMLTFVCLLWALVFGLRGYSVGNDTPGYSSFFDGSNMRGVGYGTVNDPSETMEIGFVYFARIVHAFTNSPTVFFLTIATLLFIGIFLYYQRSTENPIWCLLIFFIIGHNFNTLMVAIRQVVSISLLLIGLFFYMQYRQKEGETKFWKRFGEIIIAIAFFFASVLMHRTSVLIFPVLIILYFLKLNKTISFISICLAFILSLVGKNDIGYFFDILLANIGMIDNDTISLLGTRYESGFDETNASIIRKLAWTIPALLTISNTEKNKIGTLNYNCLVFSVIFFLLMSSSYMVTRLNVTFLLIGMTAFIPHVVNSNKKLFNIYMLITLYYLWRTYVGFENWPYWQDSSLPYKFFWE